MKISTLTKKKTVFLYFIGALVIMGTSIFATMHHSNAQTIEKNNNPVQEIKKEKIDDQVQPTQPVESKPVQMASKNYNVEQENTISGPELDKHLKGNLKGLGPNFVKSGEEHDIDPVFLAALAAQETGWGNSDIASSPWNNIGGITCMPDIYSNIFGEDYPNPGCEALVQGGTNWQKFLSIEDSIRFKATYLKQYYVENGNETIGEIQTVYAPSQAANDATGLNNNWVKNIVSIMNDVKAEQA
ncbi:glucosaminidase domain-containing protein [Fredinandcohnia sp. QZ13]|uniref:glucosaminidase domain-containing protein n=1 Tax=Fredinandcohnia sp. QZ13 TaxID=3073144 RepID=UPI0028530A29|nr:glucosaminidase domain-containing protein [Fredinandcohnia sp. QZ13]MDR4889361.1 glucosaminidase domain-containing protein [Fredinandcohnia sp. QZ13]